MLDVKIVQAPPRHVVAVEHRGPYPEIGAAFGRIAQWAGARGLMGPSNPMIGIFYDDPRSKPPSELRSHAGVVVPPAFQLPKSEPVEVVDLAAGEYAVVTHKGSYEGLAASWGSLMHEWLPTSGRKMAKRPSYEVYLNAHLMATPEILLTEIHLPLEPMR
jgi:AraC family transcriptional regulator